MKEIPLTQGKVAIVDDEDYPKLIKFKWHARKNKNTFYAGTHQKSNDPIILMHRLILNPPKGMQTDHINGNGLDNRKENLRAVTHRQNCQNKHIKKSSRFPGVTWSKQHKKWKAQIEINGKNKHLGNYTSEKEAFESYKKAVNELVS